MSCKSLIWCNEKDVVGGYCLEWGLLINIFWFLKDKNMLSEFLLYFLEKVIFDLNEKNKMIVFVSKYILDFMMDGFMYWLVFGSFFLKVVRFFDMFCLVIDGYRFDLYDFDWLFYVYINYKIEVCWLDWYKDFKFNFLFGFWFIFWMNDECECYYEILGDYKYVYGIYNFLFLIFLIMYMCFVFGEELFEYNLINLFLICDFLKKEVNGFVILNDYMFRDVFINFKEFCLFKMILESFCWFLINEIGEFDFMMFLYLDRMSKMIFEIRLF